MKEASSGGMDMLLRLEPSSVDLGGSRRRSPRSRFLGGAPFEHLKCVAVDGATAFVSSANFTQR